MHRLVVFVFAVCAAAGGESAFDVSRYGATPANAARGIGLAYAAACAAATPESPTTVLVPSGTWVVGAGGNNVVLDACQRGTVTVAGASTADSVVAVANGSHAAAIVVAGQRDAGGDTARFVIRDITLDLNRAATPRSTSREAQAAVSFVCHPAARCAFDAARVAVVNGHQMGFYLGIARPLPSPPASLAATSASVANCSFSNVAFAGVWASLWSNVAVVDVSVSGAQNGVVVEGEGCSFRPGVGVTNVSVRGGVVDSVGKSGVTFCGVRGGEIAGNVVRGSGCWGIVVSMGCSDVAIVGNTVVAAAVLPITIDVTTADPATWRDDETIYVVNGTVANNTVMGSVPVVDALNTNHAAGVLYDGNRVLVPTKGAAIAAANCRDVTFRRNFVSNSTVGIVSYSSHFAAPNQDGSHRAENNTFAAMRCCEGVGRCGARGAFLVDFSRSELPG